MQGRHPMAHDTRHEHVFARSTHAQAQVSNGACTIKVSRPSLGEMGMLAPEAGSNAQLGLKDQHLRLEWLGPENCHDFQRYWNDDPFQSLGYKERGDDGVEGSHQKRAAARQWLGVFRFRPLPTVCLPPTIFPHGVDLYKV